MVCESIATHIPISIRLPSLPSRIDIVTAFFPQTPFGGYKESGFGRIGGEYAIDNFTKVKVQTQMLL